MPRCRAKLFLFFCARCVGFVRGGLCLLPGVEVVEGEVVGKVVGVVVREGDAVALAGFEGKAIDEGGERANIVGLHLRDARAGDAFIKAISPKHVIGGIAFAAYADAEGQRGSGGGVGGL